MGASRPFHCTPACAVCKELGIGSTFEAPFALYVGPNVPDCYQPYVSSTSAFSCLCPLQRHPPKSYAHSLH